MSMMVIGEIICVVCLWWGVIWGFVEIIKEEDK